jgi:indolepyruvate ferredoxin oxidoreductase
MAERQMERRLADDYESDMRDLCRDLRPEVLDIALELASLPDRVRGFGHIKQASVSQMELARRSLLLRLNEAGTR